MFYEKVKIRLPKIDCEFCTLQFIVFSSNGYFLFSIFFFKMFFIRKGNFFQCSDLMIKHFNGLDGYCLLPCQHDGICSNGKCQCTKDYTGRYCEKIKKKKKIEGKANLETLNIILIFVSVFTFCFIVFISIIFWKNNKVTHTFHRSSLSNDDMSNKETLESDLIRQKSVEFRFSGFSNMIINRQENHIDNNN